MTGFESSGCGLRLSFPGGTGHSTISQPGKEEIPAQQQEWAAGPMTLREVGSPEGGRVQAAAMSRRAGRYPGRQRSSSRETGLGLRALSEQLN